MKTLTAQYSKRNCEGQFLDWHDYEWVISADDGPVRINKPDATPLLVYMPAVLPANFCENAYKALRGWGVRLESTKRKTAIDENSGDRNSREGVIGFLGWPDCRMSAFNIDQRERFKRVWPLLKSIDRLYAAMLPEQHAVQQAQAEKTSDWVISGTVFSTVTVNTTVQTKAHRDKGNLPGAFGCITAFQAGRYDGGFLVFPEYRVAVDIRSQDLLLCDSHSIHGNTEICGSAGKYERVSLVCYYHRGICRCPKLTELSPLPQGF